MTTFQKQCLFVLVTLLIAVMVPLGIDLLDATISGRTIAAHIIASVTTTLTALMAKFPQRIWSDAERDEKLNQP